MRGQDNNQIEMYSYIPLEKRVSQSHPLRKIKELLDNALEKMDREFDKVYSYTGRPSIPPEMLMGAGPRPGNHL